MTIKGRKKCGIPRQTNAQGDSANQLKCVYILDKYSGQTRSEHFSFWCHVNRRSLETFNTIAQLPH